MRNTRIVAAVLFASLPFAWSCAQPTSINGSDGTGGSAVQTVGTGGSSAGRSGSTATGGTPAGGSTATGGAPLTGRSSSTGGASGNATGGSTGVVGAGGSPGTSADTSTAGLTATGGPGSSTGGASAADSSTGTGGAPVTATGGPSTGGASSTGGSTAQGSTGTGSTSTGSTTGQGSTGTGSISTGAGQGSTGTGSISTGTGQGSTGTGSISTGTGQGSNGTGSTSTGSNAGQGSNGTGSTATSGNTGQGSTVNGGSAASGSTATGTGTAGVTQTGAGTIVPLYTDPTDPSWNAIITAAEAHPTVHVVAIVNPNNGPGASRDANYTSGIAALEAANIKVIGYVATGYASHSIASMEAEIDTWKSFYPTVQGIFFDEQSQATSDVPHYQTLSQYAKSVGLSYTVGNPGTGVPTAYVGVLDTELIYESNGVPPMSDLSPYSAYAPSNFGVIPYAVSAVDTTFVQQARKYVEYIYLTNADLPNPWGSLSAYFSALLTALE